MTEATGSSTAPTAAVALAAFKGQEAEAFELIEAGTKDAERRGEGQRLTFFHWATAVLCNSLGRYREALAAAQQASEDSPADLFANWAVAELIEAASRGGTPERAADAVQWLSVTTRASGTDWALGVEARSRALVSEGETAETLYREAIDRLGRTRVRLELGAPTCSTGNGCAGRTGVSTPAGSCAPRTRCSSPWERAGSPNGPGANCRPLEPPSANAPCPPGMRN